jgi:2-oxoisovalerate dehydrogenase E2 component (dihydrolipoyl transacylase)
MPFQIQMPHVGESVTEAVIGKWLKKPGERIEKYDPLVEVVTDKVAMEVPAPASGQLTRIIAEEGETVAMGAVIGEMDTDGQEAAQPDAPVAQRAVDAVPAPSPKTGSTAQPRKPATTGPTGLRVASADRVGGMITGANVGPTGGAFSDTSLGASQSMQEQAVRAERPTGSAGRLSPVVSRLIEKHGIDPSTLTGTGLGGRITRADVMKAVEKSTDPVRGAETGTLSGPPGPGYRLLKPSPVRRMIADHMSKSFREIPHAWSAIEVDVSGLVACRAANRDAVERAHGINITYLPFAIAVTARALRANPLLNSSWQADGIRLNDDVNVGIAVAGRDGLVVPVVHAADAMTVLELAIRLDAQVTKARSGTLAIGDVSGGTFTLNNTGVLGSVWGGAIINHPQAAILTTEAIVKRPVVVGPGTTGSDEVQVRPVMNICLSFDHRVIDGAEASAFLQDVKRGLEEISKDTALE